MQRTYEAILSNDRVDWTGEAPDQKKPVRVQVTILEDIPQAQDRGRKMAEALKKLAKIDAFSSIGDPVAWQREMRRERPLPGRKD